MAWPGTPRPTSTRRASGVLDTRAAPVLAVGPTVIYCHNQAHRHALDQAQRWAFVMPGLGRPAMAQTPTLTAADSLKNLLRGTVHEMRTCEERGDVPGYVLAADECDRLLERLHAVLT